MTAKWAKKGSFGGSTGPILVPDHLGTQKTSFGAKQFSKKNVFVARFWVPFWGISMQIGPKWARLGGVRGPKISF